jgi:hypothetical protein
MFRALCPVSPESCLQQLEASCANVRQELRHLPPKVLSRFLNSVTIEEMMELYDAGHDPHITLQESLRVMAD